MSLKVAIRQPRIDDKEQICSAVRIYVGYLSNPVTSPSMHPGKSVKAIAVSFLSRSWRDDSQEMS